LSTGDVGFLPKYRFAGIPPYRPEKRKRVNMREG